MVVGVIPGVSVAIGVSVGNGGVGVFVADGGGV